MLYVEKFTHGYHLIQFNKFWLNKKIRIKLNEKEYY